MNLFWVIIALVGLGCFLGGLGGAAWSGQDPSGRWREGAWRWLLLAAGGFLMMVAGLHLAGTYEVGLHYPGYNYGPPTGSGG